MLPSGKLISIWMNKKCKYRIAWINYRESYFSSSIQ
jgi:hypothetical protein